MLPEVRSARPSIDLPTLTITRRIEHMCENRTHGVLRARSEVLPERASTGTEARDSGMDGLLVRVVSAAIRCERSSHLQMRRVRGRDPHSSPYRTAAVRGAVALAGAERTVNSFVGESLPGAAEVFRLHVKRDADVRCADRGRGRRVKPSAIGPDHGKGGELAGAGRTVCISARLLYMLAFVYNWLGVGALVRTV